MSFLFIESKVIFYLLQLLKITYNQNPKRFIIVLSILVFL